MLLSSAKWRSHLAEAKRPAGFDPAELFGAALWLTRECESCGAVEERGSTGSDGNDQDENKNRQ